MTVDSFFSLRTYLNSLAPLPESEWLEFAKGLQLSTLYAGEAFIRTNGSAERVGFVTKGLMKSSYLTQRGEEFIRAFTPENNFAVALAALYQGQGTPSEVDLVALEPTELIVSDYDNLRRRHKDHWAWQQISRLIAEQAYLVRERRQHQLMTMAADERLKSFFVEHPGLASRISQKDLAAYIGITPVSLSRLRAKLKLRNKA